MSKRLASYLLQLKQNLKPVPVSQTGMWFQDKDVIVPSNRITMKGPDGSKDYFKEPIIGQGVQSGEVKVMQPGKEYHFPNDKQVFEKRMQSGGEFLLGAASFAPPPYGTAAGLASAGINLYQGDLESFGWDMAGVLTGGAAKWFKGASQAAKAAGAGRVARNMGDKARFLQTASNPNIYKTIGTARDYPNYNTPVQRTPQRESTYVAPRPRPIMQGGGTNPPDYSKFQEFNKTLPENLRNDNFKYNDPNTYDLYGMWEGSGKPNSFKDVKDGDFFPLQEDGTYHGFSVNPETGEFLKPRNHATTWMEVREGQLNPNLKDQLIIQNERGRLQYVPRTMQDGGETEIEEDDDREMVEGIADILRQVKDKNNRKQIAKKMVEDFEEEDVDYNLDNFLEASRVMQSGGFRYTSPPRRGFTTSYQQPTRSTSDNTRVVTPNTNVSSATRAMVADQRAKEAAAKRSGVIYAGTPESDYEKAKKAASFVEQSKLADGFATPLDYVLDVVNPATYAFSATDIADNTAKAAYNVSQGEFTAAGSNLLDAGLNTLDFIPVAKGSGKFLKGAVRYGDDVLQTSKIVGRPTLPKYKDVYRAEHAGFNQVATPQDITGRWAANSADEASFYVQNLKDPNTGKVMNAFAGEQAPVKIIKQRLPEYKYNQQFAEGMPEEARIMSMGPGRLSKTELDQVLGPGATKRFQTNQFSNQDLAAMQTAPFLYNPNEGILDADIINSLRQGKSTLGGKSLLFSNQNQAADYLLSQSNFSKKVSPLNKYLPFNTFQMGGMSIPGVNGTVIASTPSLYKKHKARRK
jgi:hypothetical protein